MATPETRQLTPTPETQQLAPGIALTTNLNGTVDLRVTGPDGKINTRHYMASHSTGPNMIDLAGTDGKTYVLNIAPNGRTASINQFLPDGQVITEPLNTAPAQMRPEQDPKAGTVPPAQSAAKPLQINGLEKWDPVGTNNTVHVRFDGKDHIIKQDEIFGAGGNWISASDIKDRLSRGTVNGIDYYYLKSSGADAVHEGFRHGFAFGMQDKIDAWMNSRSWAHYIKNNVEGGGKYSQEQLEAIYKDLQSKREAENPNLSTAGKVLGVGTGVAAVLGATVVTAGGFAEGATVAAAGEGTAATVAATGEAVGAGEALAAGAARTSAGRALTSLESGAGRALTTTETGATRALTAAERGPMTLRLSPVAPVASGLSRRAMVGIGLAGLGLAGLVATSSTTDATVKPPAKPAHGRRPTGSLRTPGKPNETSYPIGNGHNLIAVTDPATGRVSFVEQDGQKRTAIGPATGYPKDQGEAMKSLLGNKAYGAGTVATITQELKDGKYPPVENPTLIKVTQVTAPPPPADTAPKVQTASAIPKFDAGVAGRMMPVSGG